MMHTFTWAVERRRGLDKPWRVIQTDVEQSPVSDLKVFGSLKMIELGEYDFADPDTRLSVYRW